MNIVGMAVFIVSNVFLTSRSPMEKVGMLCSLLSFGLGEVICLSFAANFER